MGKKEVRNLNISEYKCLVRGTKEACHALFGSMEYIGTGKEILEETELEDGRWEMLLSGMSYFPIDFLCTSWGVYGSAELPEDLEEAEKFGAGYRNITLSRKALLFNAEIFCNWAAVAGYRKSDYGECGGNYMHYAADGTAIRDECPNRIRLDIREV